MNLITGTVIPVTVSIGVAGVPDPSADPKGLFRAADQAVYEAKRTGRNRVCIAAAVSGG